MIKAIVISVWEMIDSEALLAAVKPSEAAAAVMNREMEGEKIRQGHDIREAALATVSS